MNIANPFFLLLLVLPFIGFYLYTKKGKEMSAGVRFSQLGTVRKIFSSNLTRMRSLPIMLRLAVLILLILGLSRFQLGLKSKEISSQGTDIILCLDTSPSMKALDFKPKNRITVAKEVVREFIHGRKSDRIGMVVFAGKSVTACPLTSDYNSLLQFLDSINEGVTKTDGTAIGDALATSINRLKGSSAKSKIIILVTDGRSNIGMIDPLSSAKLAKSLGIKIYTIGVGKKGPAPYPVEDPVFGTRYVLLQEDLDEDTLSKIADLTSGIYERATDPESLSNIFRIIDKMEKTEFKTKIHVDYRELYPFFLWPALILFVLEIIISGTVLRKIP